MKFIFLLFSCFYISLSYSQVDTMLLYYTSGEIQSKSKYVNGICLKTIKFYKSGNVKTILRYKNDKVFANGFYENGKKSVKSVQSGKPVDDCTYSLMPSGDNSGVCHYGDLIIYERNGEYFDQDGNLFEIKYFSKVIEWYKNGQMKSKSKTKNGNGYYYEWDEEGNLIVKLE